MPVIIISSNSRDSEQEIAVKVAAKLNYSLLEPAFMADIAARHQLDSGRLEQSLVTRAPFVRSMGFRQKNYHLACIQAEVLDRFQSDNIVCWGLAAHLYVFNISHVMKIRILSSGGGNFAGTSGGKTGSEKQQQRKSSTKAFGHDETDPSLFDLVINLDQIEPEEAISTITAAAGYRKFQPMTYSIKCLADQTLAARARAELLKLMSPVDVQARDGVVIVFMKAFAWERRKKAQTIKELVGKMDGVMYVEVHSGKTMTANGTANSN